MERRTVLANMIFIVSLCVDLDTARGAEFSGCLSPGGAISKVALGNSPTAPCGAQEKRIALSSVKSIVDSSVPPRKLGDAFDPELTSSFVLFEFEGNRYLIEVERDGVDGNGRLYFQNPFCTGPAVSGYQWRSGRTWASIPTLETAVIPTPSGKRLYIQEGPVRTDALVVRSGLIYGVCRNDPTNGFPFSLGDYWPARDTGIIFERDYPPPYDLVP